MQSTNKIRVLWFEVTTPAHYVDNGPVIGGWQDSLERVVKSIPEIELVVAFMSDKYSEVKTIEKVTYVPIHATYSLFERIFQKHWNAYVKKMLPRAISIVEEYKPDLIQVFGTEWPFGQIAAYTRIPVVIHIMGAIVPYNNASFPPGFSYESQLCQNWWNPIRLLSLWKRNVDQNNWEEWERRTWKLVSNYMGRTHWDESLSRIMHPDRKYFHVEEALRPVFHERNEVWHYNGEKRIKLISTGCSSFWKGPDMMLKVARILLSLKIEFEWNVAGKMNNHVKDTVEKHEGISFESCHINILGFIQPKELVHLLCSSTMYVHTAYIENSPNSICEAQCLGVPVVSTNVGGIASLVRNEIDGILVPANDPWQMADAIVQLASDKDRMLRYSKQSSEVAIKRHGDNAIKDQLKNCYYTLLGR